MTSTVPDRLRQACDSVRRTSMPLADLIPLMQQSADKIDEMRNVLDQAEIFIAGFEDDNTQVGVNKLLREIRRHT